MNTNTFGYRVIRCITWYVCKIIPIDKKKIVFSSYYGRGYADNLKYIAEQLKDKNYKLIWMVKDDNEAKTLPSEITPCKIMSLSWVYHLSTAAVWIDNCRKVFKFKKESQFYIQTYHGGGGGKKCERDAADKLGEEYVKMSIKDAHNTDLMISSDRFMTNLYHHSFWYDGPVAELGYPRYDILLKKDKSAEKRKVDAFFHFDSDCHYILYAPTFRNDYSFKPYSMDFKRVLDCCEKRFHKKFVMLVHLHPNVATRFSEIQYNSQIINATVYPDMQELMAVSDILIGDYSSVNLEFSLMKKPVFRFAMDTDDYRNDRDMYYEMTEYPFPLAENNEDLIHAIETFDNREYLLALEHFHEKVGVILNPYSSEQCARLIEDYFDMGCNKCEFMARNDKLWK